MPKILNLDEMLDVIAEIDPTSNNREFGMFKDRIEWLGTDMAEFIGKRLNLDYSPANYEGTAFAGTCACFYPKVADQVIPAELESFDEGGEWHTLEDCDREFARMGERIRVTRR